VSSDTHDELATGSGAISVPTRVLTIGAHPDDAEFGAGATLARWAAAGSEITMLVVTDGSKGSWDPDIDQRELISQRKAEQRAAADVLGVSGIVHLDHPDGELEYSSDLRKEIALAIRRHTPSVVLTHDPWQRYQMHPDHRATGLAGVDGVVSAREPLALRDSGLPAHRPAVMLLWSADEPDHAESVGTESFDHKLAAVLCHSSQGQTTMGNATDDEGKQEAFAEKLRTWHMEQGERLGVGASEVFKRLTP
jgi:LmbE family N-acetylglucosaminyl deacetylase